MNFSERVSVLELKAVLELKCKPNVRISQHFENKYWEGILIKEVNNWFLRCLLHSWFFIMIVFFMGMNKQKWVRSVRGPKKEMGAARLKTTTATEARFGWAGLENIRLILSRGRHWHCENCCVLMLTQVWIKHPSTDNMNHDIKYRVGKGNVWKFLL